MNNILMTSGYNFEGYTISKYLGVFSGECALGTGFLSSLGAGFADFLGSNSNMYSGKLRKAKSYAIEKLAEQVQSIGGNAIIGLDIDYTSFSLDIMGVIASGTAVRITPNAESPAPAAPAKYSIKTTNRNLPFLPVYVFVDPTPSSAAISLDIYCTEPCNISGVLGDLLITTVFHDTYTARNVEFIEFTKQSQKHLVSSSTLCEIPSGILRTIQNINFTTKKYIQDNMLIEAPAFESPTADSFLKDAFDIWTFDFDDFMRTVDSYQTAREIFAFLKEYYSDHPDILSPALLDEIEKLISLERIYGNMKASVVGKLRDYLK